MAVQIVVAHRPETMTTEVYVYDVQTDPLERRHLTSTGTWEDAGPAGMAVLPTYVVPDDILPRLVSALGVPMSDVHLLESLRVERSRVDRLLDRTLELMS